jgi:oligopeptide transport system ATP-binding protein
MPDRTGESESSTRSAHPLVRVSSVSVHFEVRHSGWRSHGQTLLRAVDSVSLDICESEIVGLVGESGSGKSTLGRAIVQLVGITSGSIWFQNEELQHRSARELRELRKHLQIIFQDSSSSLNRRLSIGDVIERPMVLQGSHSRLERKARVDTLLDRVGLDPGFRDRYPYELSGGQRQRVGIARALATEPRFIVCDEPLSALDVSIQAQIVELLAELQRDLGLTYLFIAHDLAVVRELANRVAVMYLGQIVEIAPTAELFESPKHPYSMALISAAPIPDPDVERTRQRIILKGELPSPLSRAGGCSFASRCPFVRDRCNHEAPSLEPVSPVRSVACHFWRELDPTGTNL